MSGIGPAPAETRRRKNEPGRGDWVTLEPLKKKVLPALPKRTKAEGPWPAITKTAWAAWRADPVTQLYGPADVSFALDTIRLHAMMTPSSANEVRLRMTALGLTPEGKIKLRIRIGEPADQTEPEKTSSTRSKKRSNRRARLTVVPND